MEIYNCPINVKDVKLAFIGGYPLMSQYLKEIAEESGIVLYNICATFHDAITTAIELEPEVDAVLSRGLTSALLRDAISVPVVSIPITPFDLCATLRKIPSEIDTIAFLNYERNLYGIEEIGRILSKNIVSYTFLSTDDIIMNIKDAKSRGIKAVVGGGLIVRLANEAGLLGVEANCGRETIYQAFQEAMTVIDEKRRERVREIRLKVAFDSIAEGIVVSDEFQNISVCNPSAERFFNLNKGAAIGKSSVLLALGKNIERAYSSKAPEINYLQKINNSIININHLPIFMSDRFLGIVSTYQDVTKIQNLEAQIRQKLSEKGFWAKHTLSDVITVTPEVKLEIKKAEVYAKTQSAILIEGESGTGKELFAQGIHNASNCAGGPFVAVNCAAIPENLLESELFGYEAGAFTGAKKEGKSGLFELAHNGSIFLDEIGEIPHHIQLRLLRVIQEKEIMRVGGEKMISVNCRVISATNKNLKEKVAAGEFREDLYYRLNVFNISIPPLRERKNDIPLLFRHFLEEMNAGALLVREEEYQSLNRLFMQYDWPGNIRELYNYAERCTVLTSVEDIGSDEISLLDEVIKKPIWRTLHSLAVNVDLNQNIKTELERIEKEIILKTMELYDNDRSVVMEKLGISRTTLWRFTNKEPNEMFQE
jgi:transcriptional regulator with PAS, ATPase and Fis domain